MARCVDTIKEKRCQTKNETKDEREEGEGERDFTSHSVHLAKNCLLSTGFYTMRNKLIGGTPQ